MSQRLTDKMVKGLPTPAVGNRITYDSETGGFGVRITAGNAIAFILNYRVKDTGRERRYTIGRFPNWSVAAAREKAKELKRHVDSGGDPIGELKTSRAAPTVAELCDDFEAAHVAKLRPHSQRDYRKIIHKEIVPALGELKVAEVKLKDVDRLHRRISERPALYQANRVLAVLSKMFALAIKWEMRPDNPCRGVERNREHARKRYLTPDELARLTAALAEYRDQQAANIFRLLLLTGARRGEVLTARWEQFDLKAGVWTKPATVTKQKTEHPIPLSAPARQLLAGLPRKDGEPWLFPGRAGMYRVNLDRSWGALCKAAGITGLRIHDLRHSYASTLAGAGFSLPVIGALLGHSQPATTARYAHLYDDPLRKATERAGAILSPKAKSGGKVVGTIGRRS